MPISSGDEILISCGAAALDGVEDEGERAPCLPAVLRAEAEEDDAAFAQADLDECGAAREMCQKLGIDEVLITISHCRTHATAYAVAVGDQ